MGKNTNKRNIKINQIENLKMCTTGFLGNYTQHKKINIETNQIGHTLSMSAGVILIRPKFGSGLNGVGKCEVGVF